MILLSLLLILSLVANGIMVWYSRKVTKQFSYAVLNVEEYQKLLDQYQYTLKSIYELESFYGDQELKVAIEHTKIVADACAAFKTTLIKSTGEKIESTEETTEEAKE
jgi:hypothetical protein